MTDLAVVLEVANVALLAYLLYTYLQNYRQMKSTFTLGLVVFAVLLIVQNGLAAYFHLAMQSYYSMEAMQHAEFVNAAQTLALGVLAWVTWKG